MGEGRERLEAGDDARDVGRRGAAHRCQQRRAAGLGDHPLGVALAQRQHAQRKVAGDFDGSGKASFGVYNYNTAQWYLQIPTAGYVTFSLGQPNATLPVDTVGLLRASNEVRFKPKLYGGAFLGLLVTGIKQQLGPLINGLVNNEFYIPAASLQFAGTKEFLEDYQKRAPALGIDPLGFTYPPYAYAAGQILAKAVSETKSLDDDTLADYIRKNTIETVIGPIRLSVIRAVASSTACAATCARRSTRFPR